MVTASLHFIATFRVTCNAIGMKRDSNGDVRPSFPAKAIGNTIYGVSLLSVAHLLRMPNIAPMLRAQTCLQAIFSSFPNHVPSSVHRLS